MVYYSWPEKELINSNTCSGLLSSPEKNGGLNKSLSYIDESTADSHFTALKLVKSHVIFTKLHIMSLIHSHIGCHYYTVT